MRHLATECLLKPNPFSMAHEEERASNSIIQELKAEIQELRTQICGGVPKSVSTFSLVVKPKEKPKKTEKN